MLKKNGAVVESDDFTAKTPRGMVEVHNIIGKFNVSADPKQPIFATLADPKFRADAKARNLDVVSATGQEVEALVRRTLDVPQEDLDAMNRLLAPKK